jgi:hypothetical protein
LISCGRRRQWRRADIPVPSFLQDGENSLGDGNTIAAWEGTGMPVWFGRWLQGADTLQTPDGIAIQMGRDFGARLLAGQVTRDPAATGRRCRKPTDTRHMIVETMRCTRESARMRRTMEARSTEAVQAGVRPAEGITKGRNP